MSNFDRVYETGADRYGIVTTEDAAELGIHRKQLLAWEKIGRLERCGRGVYRLEHHVPTPYDHYAEAVALVGRGAIVYGDAVLSMHGLALVDPPWIRIAVGRRVRRNLPEWIRLVDKPAGTKEELFEGSPCQTVADAIRACRGKVMAERLAEAVEEAARRGLIGLRDHEELRREFA